MKEQITIIKEQTMKLENKLGLYLIVSIISLLCSFAAIVFGAILDNYVISLIGFGTLIIAQRIIAKHFVNKDSI